MSEIILSIKPEYVERIIKGQKLYEYRKRLPSDTIEAIYIYCTYPVMKVVAKVQVKGKIKASPTALWEQTKHAAGISRNNYRVYFKGCKTAYAFILGELNVFDSPKAISEYGFSIPPQSFAYISGDNK